MLSPRLTCFPAVKYVSMLCLQPVLVLKSSRHREKMPKRRLNFNLASLQSLSLSTPLPAYLPREADVLADRICQLHLALVNESKEGCSHQRLCAAMQAAERAESKGAASRARLQSRPSVPARTAPLRLGKAWQGARARSFHEFANRREEVTQGETGKETEREWGSFKEDRGKEHTESRVSRHIGLVGFEHFNYDFQLIKNKGTFWHGRLRR